MEYSFIFSFVIYIIFIFLFSNTNSENCPNVFPYYGIISSCVLKNRNQVNCFGNLSGVVKAYVQCESGYFNLRNISHQTLHCRDDKWSEEIIECFPECVDSPNQIKLLEDSDLEFQPWYAEIIQKTKEGNIINRIPGIILNENLVLTLQKFYDTFSAIRIGGKFLVRIYKNKAQFTEQEISTVRCHNEKIQVLEESEKFCIFKISDEEYIEFGEYVKPICSNGKNFSSITQLIQFCTKYRNKNILKKCIVPPDNDLKVEILCLKEVSDDSDNKTKNLIQTNCFENSEYLVRRCKIGYHYLNSNQDDYLNGCVKGSWVHEENECVLKCGKLDETNEDLIDLRLQSKYTDKKSTINLAPWHVAIFQKNTHFTFEHICGGTIIKTNIVLSAAHCFYDKLKSEVEKTSNFLLGTGYQSHYAGEMENNFFTEIKEIHIPKNYGTIDKSNNIAVIIVKNHFIFSQDIKPICIDINYFDNCSYKSEITGNFTRWRHTSDNVQLNNIFLITNLTTLSNDECKKEIDRNLISNVGEDKFCAINNKNATIYASDSGSGFIIRKTIGFEEHYFLKGISSIDFKMKNSSDGFAMLFTDVQFHQTFIKDVILKNRNENLISVNNKIFKRENNTCQPSKIKNIVYLDEVCGKVDGYDILEKNTDITSAPWHTGIFFKDSNEYQHCCGGTIISSNIILSSVRGFYDIVNKKLKNASDYIVGAGKRYKTYYSPEIHAYYIRVKEIHMPVEYNSGNSYHDLSILILREHFIFSSYIRPICLHFIDYTSFDIKHGIKGFISGYPEEDQYGKELTIANYIGISNSECKNLLNVAMQSIFANDKFCAERESNTTRIHGDARGGFVVKKDIGSGERYYLIGVLSFSVWSNTSFSNRYLSVLTDIQLLQNFVMKIILKYNNIKNIKTGLNKVCGKIDNNDHLNRNIDDITSAPWHVGIFLIDSKEYRHICGGTIISSNMVLSAVSGFYDRLNKKLYDASNYVVGAGKRYKNYYAFEEHAYYRSVQKIYKPSDYDSLSNLHDLSILILREHFAFSSYIRPVCLHFIDYSDFIINYGMKGSISGYPEENSNTKELTTTNYIAIPNKECKNFFNTITKSFITSDKFCAKRENNSTRIHGDARGGFVMKKDIGYGEKYYLSGVLSFSSSPTTDYLSEPISVLTNIQFLQNFIKEIMARNIDDNIISVYNNIYESIKDIFD